MGIEWQEGDVCFAAGTKWDSDNDFSDALNCKDFQLNTIKQGDYIEASELDTEQKYNDAVEVFGLFGFNSNVSYEKHIEYGTNFVVIENNEVDGVRKEKDYCIRKLTYPQIMVIGELKRLELERKRKEVLSPKGGVTVKQGVKMQKNKPVVAQVMIDLTERMEIGIKTYGEALRANNGRDALQDAYEEALDLACYLKQAMIERDNENTK